MSEIRKIVRVFLASPGDLAEERKAAKSVIDEINVTFAGAFGYQAELVGWEDTVSVYGRPQEIINRELEGCELFIGMMWKHWGTPPSLSGQFTSGFEEEFETSRLRRERTGSPEISMLFKSISSEFLRDPGSGLKRVLDFKEKLILEKKILFESFSDLREFESKLRRCVSKYILTKIQSEDQADPQRSPIPKDERLPQDKKNNVSLFSEQGEHFIRSLLGKAHSPDQTNAISAVEIARLRLLAALIGQHANDKIFLGVHDANLIYLQANHSDLGRPELFALLGAGLFHYKQENVPIWKWERDIEKSSGAALVYFSLGNDIPERTISALQLMKLTRTPLNLEKAARDYFISQWLKIDTPSGIKHAALGYLGTCGGLEDLTVLREEHERNDPQTVTAASEAIIRLSFAKGRPSAISALYELQPIAVGRDLLETILDDGFALSDDLLLQGTRHRCPEVRRITTELLVRRDALPEDVAASLLEDNDARTRFEAFSCLVLRGRTFSPSAARAILVASSKEGGGLLNFTVDGEEYLERYQNDVLRKLDDAELERHNADAIFFDMSAYFVLAERRFSERRVELIDAVKGEYKVQFAHRLATYQAKFGDNSDLTKSLNGLEEATRRTWTRQALNTICRKSIRSDVGVVRDALRRGFVGVSLDDLAFLKKNGEKDDIPQIIECLGRPRPHYNLYSLKERELDLRNAAVQTIFALGKNRLNDIFTLAESSELQVRLIAASPESAFSELSDTAILNLLMSKEEQVRKITAIKCVKAFARSRLSSLYQTYITSNSQFFYNVVHWLDLGLSVPKKRSGSVVASVIKQFQ